eukprot:scaffold29_cov251-Pinguiococcus_pyrenoidosus.AAC.26
MSKRSSLSGRPTTSEDVWKARSSTPRLPPFVGPRISSAEDTRHRRPPRWEMIDSALIGSQQRSFDSALSRFARLLLSPR